jgi:hypothetical protein
MPIEYFGGNSHQYAAANAGKPATTMYDVNYCDGAAKMAGGGRRRSRSRRSRSRSRQRGGRVTMPIEYFGGNSHQYAAANAGKPATTMYDVNYCDGGAAAASS